MRVVFAGVGLPAVGAGAARVGALGLARGWVGYNV